MKKFNKIKKQIKNIIPAEQIKYDFGIIQKHFDKKKRYRQIVSNSITAVSFVFVIAAIVLFVLFFWTGNSVFYDGSRIMENIQELFFRGSSQILVNLKFNLLSLYETIIYTVSVLIIPNFLYLGIGVKLFIGKAVEIFSSQKGFTHLFETFEPKVKLFLDGLQQLFTTLKDNFSVIIQVMKKISNEMVQKGN